MGQLEARRARATESGGEAVSEHEDTVMRAATKFVRAAKNLREIDVRRARQERTADAVEHLGALEEYHRAMAALAGAEQDLILAVEDQEAP